MTKIRISGLVSATLLTALVSSFSLTAQAVEALRVAAGPVPHAFSPD